MIAILVSVGLLGSASATPPPLKARIIASIDKPGGAVLLLDKGLRDGLRIGDRGHVCGRYRITVVEAWKGRAKAKAATGGGDLRGCKAALFARRPERTVQIRARVVSWLIEQGHASVQLDKGDQDGLAVGRAGTLCGKDPVTVERTHQRRSEARTKASRERLEACSHVTFPAYRPKPRKKLTKAR